MIIPRTSPAKGEITPRGIEQAPRRADCGQCGPGGRKDDHRDTSGCVTARGRTGAAERSFGGCANGFCRYASEAPCGNRCTNLAGCGRRQVRPAPGGARRAATAPLVRAPDRRHSPARHRGRRTGRLGQDDPAGQLAADRRHQPVRVAVAGQPRQRSAGVLVGRDGGAAPRRRGDLGPAERAQHRRRRRQRLRRTVPRRRGPAHLARRPRAGRRARAARRRKSSATSRA